MCSLASPTHPLNSYPAMKTIPLRLLLVGMLVLAFASPSALAQRQLGKKKGPVSKLYVAETKGQTEIQNGDKIYTIRQATAFDAPGTVIETKAESHDTLVYSNGTGLFVGENTRVEINHFSQEPFRANRNQLDSPYEPSVSQSDVFISRGAVGLCTNQLISGSAMLYSTPLAMINIRGGRLVIEAAATETIIDLLEGDLTVRHGPKDVSGQILRAGERATVRPAAGPGLDPVITIEPIPRSALARDDDRTAMACNARKSVTFEAIEKLADAGLEQAGTAGRPSEGEAAGAAALQEIVAKPTVPQNPPTNIVISPDRLPGT